MVLVEYIGLVLFFIIVLLNIFCVLYVWLIVIYGIFLVLK